MQKTKKLIVFDLDGTLYKTESSFLPAVRKFVDLHHRPIPPDDLLYSFIGEPEKTFADWIEKMKIDKDTDRLVQEFDRIEFEEIRNCGCLYESVIETLEWLQSEGYIMAICSNGPGWYIKEVLTNFGIDRFFMLKKGPLSENDTKEKMLEEIYYTVKPSIAYMVGDRYHDLEAARKCEFIFIGASYGYGVTEIADADYIIDSIADLKLILGQL